MKDITATEETTMPIMTKTAPTAAPWLLCPSTINGRPSGKTHIEGPNGESVGIVNTHWPEGEANARLAVAAPEMQAILWGLVYSIDDREKYIDQARMLLTRILEG